MQHPQCGRGLLRCGRGLPGLGQKSTLKIKENINQKKDFQLFPEFSIVKTRKRSIFAVNV
ncbi:MAG: hypothetical protein LBH32_10155 [Dysgonamonadaceae bacterium]|nr:hypothetical protein [Dysgonamonadaceae bacterium]